MTKKNLLLACYELGHQPLSLAWPLAALSAAGLNSHAYDLSIDDFPTERAKEAQFVGIAVPMHTALRLGVEAANLVRQVNPNAHICFFGHYAWLNADYLLEILADSVIAGEYEAPLVGLIKAVNDAQDINAIVGVSTKTTRNIPHIERIEFQIPERTNLPSLDKYAHYNSNGNHELVAYVETSRGCLHTCNHCPIVPVYQGRFFIIPKEIVLADIRQQVAEGAKHISFGDPDFLNGPNHALKIIREMHAEYPEITFSFTTKVEHILEQKEIIKEFSTMGCSFIITACEATSEKILTRLDKGHTLPQIKEALQLLQNLGISPQPTWMPFTPWTSLADYIEFLAWVKEQELIPFIPAVQFAVRMLVPPGSALLNHPDVENWCGKLDQETFPYRWTHADPKMDELHQIISSIAAENQQENPYKVFKMIETETYKIAGKQLPIWNKPLQNIPSPPKMTENWFC